MSSKPTNYTATTSDGSTITRTSAVVTRKNVNGRVAYYLETEDGVHRIYCGRNRRYFIKSGGEEVAVFFNQLLFEPWAHNPQITEIPMIHNDDDHVWEMEHEYAQTSGSLQILEAVAS